MCIGMMFQYMCHIRSDLSEAKVGVGLIDASKKAVQPMRAATRRWAITQCARQRRHHRAARSLEGGKQFLQKWAEDRVRMCDEGTCLCVGDVDAVGVLFPRPAMIGHRLTSEAAMRKR
eukprot:CAMPEP_0181192218 /NCGR_PEP_ID=MMETSP1096-20121128/13164_1 /TAXON_ID=156174 ORGANISM="Chrysochromulina ericina, Strain CCMP281" /NCGR_SAMPLE_ID=MMETSP1096 /ASSEMBLY_ACC=CAM_ASM_000453 /LENGTH=117 /DNA_ID=CAMNT_0023281595 /DNA_START=856 /DNA_END=1206 /DNA_ORIENTATION=-